jgi:hypothetical protein
MADNIQIVGSILNTTQVSRYSTEDLRLITAQKLQKTFGAYDDYIEYFVYDAGGNLLDTVYNYHEYKLPTNASLSPTISGSFNISNNTVGGNQVGTTSNLSLSSSRYPIIEIDPVQDLESLGYSSGEFKVQYNIFKNRISSFPSAELFIKEISPDRTELRVGSVTLSDSQIESGSVDLINYYNSSSYFDPFLLNFGNNKQSIATNIVLNKVDTGYEILFKLYNSLDVNITEKSSLWVVEEISTPYMFDINLDALLAAPTGSKLRGPNFNNISRFGLGSTTSPYSNNFSLNQEGLFNLNASQSIDINVNYDGLSGDNGGFSSFVTFGSALSRVQNFYSKMQQIESYKILIGNYLPNVSTTSSLQSEINSYSSSINDIITNFDGFENYLYFNSGSLTSSLQYGVTPYPKSTSTLPYVAFSTTSSQAITWYKASSTNADDYDSNNVNYFKYSVPGYVVDDPANSNYITFLNMMGQYFDNIWIYIKSVTDRNLSNNNLNVGVSKDVVYNLLQSLGISIFNSFGNNDIANYLIGANTGSVYYSGSLVDFSATSSYLNNVPKKDILAESYKRIYHNLPLLLQRKGTVAGLQTLLTTFGIQNKDYYTVSGSTFYNATGNSLTSSILNIKEFGGATTPELLKGYNNDKVRIVNNITTGSVLSSLISIQQYTSESYKDRTQDEHIVDISFSPQTQINTYISQSISSNNPSWVIDDYIGDPRRLYSGSYKDLNIQKNIYFGGTGSYAGFTGSYMDYNGFIRLIQFFDNSLFKMLEDYVPGRTSLSTGVTIASPVLERNKISYARTNNTSNVSVGKGEVSGSKISSPYNNYYNALSGSKAAYFTGAISGSILHIYNDYFTPRASNPYTKDLNVYNQGKTPVQQLDTQDFYHSNFNILLNNVSGSRPSLRRRKLEVSGSTGYIGLGSTNILYTASLQDSYISLDSYRLPRHNGVKVSSATYNTYTTSSTNYSGDTSYGKTAAIDHYVRKFGLFTQIVSSSFLPLRNQTALKYLVDDSGSLTELNQTETTKFDSSWIEVQNTFKLGKTAVVSLFDNQQYSDQKNTDGIKTIFDSGYSYYPILYYSGSDPKLYFQYVGKGTGILMHFNNGGYYISGSTPLYYPVTLSTGGVYGIFDTSDANFANGNSYYYNIRLGSGSANYVNNFPTYSVPQNANMGFSANFAVNLQFATASQSSSYQFSIVASGSTLNNITLASQALSFTSSVGNLATTLVFNVTSSYRDFVPGDQVYFKLIQSGLTTNNFTASLARTGTGTPYDGLRNTLSATTTGINPFATGSFITGSNGIDTLILNKSLSSFADYQYLPLTSSFGLYDNYGNVNNTFSPKVGDVLLVYYNNGSQLQELDISSIFTDSNGQYNIKVTPNLVSNLATGSYNSNTVSQLLLLSKVPDETNINLTFNKDNGSTSYGFIIPSNLAPDILENIDTITRQVKTKLLSNQSGITINTV